MNYKLRSFLNDADIKKSQDLFLINPRPIEAHYNLEYLKRIGFNVSENDSYLAPMYEKNKVEDKTLLDIIESKKPKYIIINLGGGVQEKLGAWLKTNVSYKPAIICTGAAIAFWQNDRKRWR